MKQEIDKQQFISLIGGLIAVYLLNHYLVIISIRVNFATKL